MVKRTEYLKKLEMWQDEQIIKVVTGIRRCGKSTLLEQFQQHLLSKGVKNEQILSLNFEELENEPLITRLYINIWFPDSVQIKRHTFFWMKFKRFLHLKKLWTVSMLRNMLTCISPAPMHICFPEN